MWGELARCNLVILDIPHERRFAQSLHDGVIVHQDRRLVLADRGDRLVQQRGQIESVALPIAGQILAAGFDRTVGVDAPRTTDADERREPKLVFLGRLGQAFEHADQAVDGLLAARLFIAMAPQLELADLGF